MASMLRRFVWISVAIWALPMRNAHACVSDAPNLPVYAAAFIVGITLAVVLIAGVWIIKWIFFRKAVNFSVFAFASIALGIILGALGTWMVPAFEDVFSSFGADLPAPTEFLLEFKYFLWAPLLLIVISWRPLRSNTFRSRYYLAGFFCEAMLLSSALAALYMPIFKLGCVE